MSFMQKKKMLLKGYQLFPVVLPLGSTQARSIIKKGDVQKIRGAFKKVSSNGYAARCSSLWAQHTHWEGIFSLILSKQGEENFFLRPTPVTNIKPEMDYVGYSFTFSNGLLIPCEIAEANCFNADVLTEYQKKLMPILFEVAKLVGEASIGFTINLKWKSALDQIMIPAHEHEATPEGCFIERLKIKKGSDSSQAVTWPMFTKEYMHPWTHWMLPKSVHPPY